MYKKTSLWWILTASIIAITAHFLSAIGYLDHSSQFAIVIFITRAIFSFSIACGIAVFLALVFLLLRRKFSLRRVIFFSVCIWPVISIVLALPGVTRPAPVGMVHLFSF